MTDTTSKSVPKQDNIKPGSFAQSLRNLGKEIDDFGKGIDDLEKEVDGLGKGIDNLASMISEKTHPKLSDSYSEASSIASDDHDMYSSSVLEENENNNGTHVREACYKIIDNYINSRKTKINKAQNTSYFSGENLMGQIRAAYVNCLRYYKENEITTNLLMLNIYLMNHVAKYNSPNASNVTDECLNEYFLQMKHIENIHPDFYIELVNIFGESKTLQLIGLGDNSSKVVIKTDIDKYSDIGFSFVSKFCHNLKSVFNEIFYYPTLKWFDTNNKILKWFDPDNKILNIENIMWKILEKCIEINNKDLFDELNEKFITSDIIYNDCDPEEKIRIMDLCEYINPTTFDRLVEIFGHDRLKNAKCCNGFNFLANAAYSDNIELFLHLVVKYDYSMIYNERKEHGWRTLANKDFINKIRQIDCLNRHYVAYEVINDEEICNKLLVIKMNELNNNVQNLVDNQISMITKLDLLLNKN